MEVKTSSKYLSKYDSIIKKYNLLELQNLLDNCKSKTDLALKLGISLKYFNEIIKLNNLIYTSKPKGLPQGYRHKPMLIDNTKTVEQRLNSQMIDEENAINKFYDELKIKRRKRIMKELLDPYGD